MTLKADGTNGILQQYDYQVLTTGFTYTFAAGTTVLVINPAGTLATGTITFPAAPVDGMTVTFSSTQTITALTLSGNSKTIVSAATILPANQATTYVYRLSNTTWYPMSNVATNTLTSPTITSPSISGAVMSTMASSVITSVAPVAFGSFTTTTYNDFLSIPSWVKRITVMINGISLSGSDNLLIQIGSGSVSSSSYASGSSYLPNGSAIIAANSTAGFLLTSSGSASNVYYGQAILSLYGTNAWTFSSALSRADTVTYSAAGVSPGLGGALDRLRFTVTGSNTFDAGAISIMYE